MTNCEFHSTIIATRMALDTDGETMIPVCDSCSYLNRFWGSWPITQELIKDELITENEIAAALPDSAPTFTLWIAKDGSQRVSFPTLMRDRDGQKVFTNMLLITIALCSRGYITELTRTSQYCLAIKRLAAIR